MRRLELGIFILGFTLMGVHGFFDSIFLVDWYTLIIFAMISLPLLFRYLEKLKIPGAEFTFRKRVNLLEKNYEKNKESIKPDKKTEELIKKSKRAYSTFDFSIAREYIETNPNIALVSIRIEIEKKLRQAHSIISKTKYKHASLKQIALDFQNAKIINQYQSRLLMEVISICNSAAHGINIDLNDAKSVLKIAEELNKSFSIGYCLNFNSNEWYKEQGLSCPWEHCIELMNLPKDRTKESCPIYGHDCPGGENQVMKCKPYEKDLWENIRKRMVR